MSAPLTFQGSLSFPPDPGGANAPITINFASQFTQILAETLTLTGSGSRAIDLSALNGGAGASAIVVKVDAQAPATPAIFLKTNSETSGMELQPGAFWAYGEPSPAAGITQLTVVWTGVGTVRIWALG
jgi:hypothetical protein